MKIQILSLALFFLQYCSGLKILGLFPHPGKSHHDVFVALLEGLADRGHDVTVMSHFPLKVPKKNYRDVSLQGSMPLWLNFIDLNVFGWRSIVNPLLEFYFLTQNSYEACGVVLATEQLRTLLAEGVKYDVIFTESFTSDCTLGVAYHFRAPVIGLSSSYAMPWVMDRFANPDLQSYIPSMFTGNSHSMGYFKRMTNFLSSCMFKVLYKFRVDWRTDDLLRKRFGEDMPSVLDLKKNITLLMINTHYALSGVRPNVPAVVEIGGIHVKPAKKLSKDLEDFMSGAKHGVVYVSWGSMVRAETLPDGKREALLESFGKLEQRVLWKWENESLPGKPDNLMIKNWMPQNDILAHPNVRLFMSHGGLLGTTEAAHHGVPVIATPIYGDQFLNSAAVAARGMGQVLHYEDLNEPAISAALQEVLKPSYARNAKRVSSAFRDRPQSALDLAVWWTERVAREGLQKPLWRSEAVDMPFYQYLLLDVILGMVMFVITTLWVFRALIRKLRSTKKSKAKTQ